MTPFLASLAHIPYLPDTVTEFVEVHKALILCGIQNTARLVEAMRVLRAKNIVHRDLKPQNLLLHDYNKTAHPSAHDLTLKVADFGLARYLADDSLAKSILGTRHYMAPEVAKAYWEGRPANYTPSVDLWAIGIILVECFTGNRPSLVSYSCQARTTQYG